MEGKMPWQVCYRIRDLTGAILVDDYKLAMDHAKQLRTHGASDLRVVPSESDAGDMSASFPELSEYAALRV